MRRSIWWASMGGNIAMMYAGCARSGCAASSTWKALACPPAARPRLRAGWRSGWTKSRPRTRETRRLRHYASADDVARRLMKTNPACLPTRRCGWPTTGPRPMPRGNGASWAMPGTRWSTPALPGGGGAGCSPAHHRARAGCGRPQPDGPVVAGPLHAGRIPRAPESRAQPANRGGGRCGPCCTTTSRCGWHR